MGPHGVLHGVLHGAPWGTPWGPMGYHMGPHGVPHGVLEKIKIKKNEKRPLDASHDALRWSERFERCSKGSQGLQKGFDKCSKGFRPSLVGPKSSPAPLPSPLPLLPPLPPSPFPPRSASPRRNDGPPSAPRNDGPPSAPMAGEDKDQAHGGGDHQARDDGQRAERLHRERDRRQV